MADNLENALYVVATPIGNLGDITLRAIDILRNCDIIAAEDTRNTSILLKKYSITTHLISYHKFCESKRTELFINYLKEGKSVALVSDAGVPLISDPGSVLVEKVRQEGYSVIPIPGASAVITLLSCIPRACEDFKFIGFMPRQEFQILDTILKNNQENLIFYESPNRLLKTLEIIKTNLPDKKIAIGRELTKKFEEIKIDKTDKIYEYYKLNPPKGEIAAMLYKSKEKSRDFDIEIQKLKALNLKDKEIASILSVLFKANKNDIYKKCIEN